MMYAPPQLTEFSGIGEDERSPLDPKIENTVFSSFEEISYGTESAIETDIEFNKTSSTLDTESDNLYSSDSSFGPWRSHYIAEYTIPKFGGDYDELLETLDSTHAQVAVMKQQYIEILEDLRRKLK
ncbi:hypothetical protein TELCIR_02432 [Teladorsagia circumcincta]|uniref:Uncharacterized protein n=1 Tax=Teladorsagia circumcincta TaxID=45464 RepID=A0A2G9UZ33_TELCI|nr:hypothetical protein TELCIR_02432 [Teladorsagia circumcincta]